MPYGIKEDQNMSRKKHTPEEIAAELRQVDVSVSQQSPVADAVRQIGAFFGVELRHPDATRPTPASLTAFSTPRWRLG
jgi:adenosylmethionine-8-amino-7-oxononanoate aminotransferase